MKLDLVKSDYNSQEEYEEYIYGSADVVGLMCLKVFVSGQDNKYEELKVKPCAWDLLFKSKLLT
jgi:phytoene/squalene synthetase